MGACFARSAWRIRDILGGFDRFASSSLDAGSRRRLERHAHHDLGRVLAALGVELAHVRVRHQRRAHRHEAHRGRRGQQETPDELLSRTVRCFRALEQSHHGIGVGELQRARHGGSHFDIERKRGRRDDDEPQQGQAQGRVEIGSPGRNGVSKKTITVLAASPTKINVT